MKPEDFDEDAVNAQADAIIASTSSITDIGKLPSYEEFVEHTGYTSTNLSLTKFREKYGIGSAFSAPTTDVVIYITVADELDLLSSLVTYKASQETAAEQSYYSTASYALSNNIKYTNTRYVPIGTGSYPFNGTLDGEGYELTGITISEDSSTTYQGIGAFGVFGYIGEDGTVQNLGVTEMNVTLPYTIGADIGVLCGNNHGQILDCYVNSADTSKIKASNATVGGISAENYGTIARTYADYTADVAITSGSYSDPQPIAAVNSGTITYSYYMPGEDSKYGTEADYEDFANGLPGTKFKNGVVDKSITMAYPTEYMMANFIKQVGTGSTFNLSKARKLLSDNAVLTIAGQNETGAVEAWNLFADRVNHTADNETDAEQDFYAHVTVYLGGYSYQYYGNQRRYYDRMATGMFYGSNNLLTPIGTADYPFYGTLDGDMSTIKYVIYGSNQVHFAEMPSLFGVIGEGGCVKNINVDVSGWEDKYYDGFDTKSAVIFKENNGTVENCHVKGINLEWQDGIGGSFDFSSKIYSIGLVNNGTVRNTDTSFAYWQMYDVHTLNAIEVNNGTIDNLVVYFHSANAGYNHIGTLSNDKNIANYQLTVKLNQPVGEQYERTTYTVQQYPALCLVTADDKGTYHITKPSELMYFIKNGTGEKIVLDNTIDMTYNLIDQEYTGSFELDGTLTDEDDICSYIDLGTGTKCYGILNLSFRNAILSKGTINMSNVYFIGGTYTIQNWSIPYYTHRGLETPIETRSDIHAMYIYANNIQNVHSSMNVNWNSLTGGDYSSYLAISLSKIAKDSSHAGTVNFVQSSSSKAILCGVGMLADHCTSYCKLLNAASSANNTIRIYAIGHNVKNSPVHTNWTESQSSGQYYMRVEIFAAGCEMENCIAGGRYELVSGKGIAATVYLFGSEQSKNCVFTGYTKQNGTEKIYLAGNADGVVFDTTAIAENSYLGCYQGKNVIFRGTINTTIAYDVKALGEYLDACYNIGTIRIKQEGECSGRTCGVGTNITNGVMAGTIHYLKNGDSWLTGDSYAFTGVYYFGSGSGMNLTDIRLTDVPLNTYGIGIFKDTYNLPCYNYGDIDIQAENHAYAFYIGNNVNRCANFGAVNLTGQNVYFYGGYYRLATNMQYKNGQIANSRNVNFGDIDIRISKTGSGSQSNVVYPVYVEQASAYTGRNSFFETAKDNYNLGNITVTGDTNNTSAKPDVSVYGCFGGKNYGTITVNNLMGNGANTVFGATLENYGDITVDGMGGRNLTIAGINYAPKYNSNIHGTTPFKNNVINTGSITLNNSTFTEDVKCYALTGSLSSPYTTVSMENRGDLTVDTVTAKNLYVCGGVGGVDNISGTKTVKTTNNTISLSVLTSSDTAKIYGVTDGDAYSITNGNVMLTSTTKAITMDNFNVKNIEVYGISERSDKAAIGDVVENPADITLSHGTITGTIKVFGVGSIINAPSVNSGNITLNAISTSAYGYIGGVGDSSSTSVLNRGSIHFTGINTGYNNIYLTGCCYKASAANNALVMNAGNITVDGNVPYMYISGIANNITAKENHGLLLNTGSITVTPTNGNHIRCGGITSGTTNARLLNAVNSGDITVNDRYSRVLYKEIYGVGCAKDMQSVVNWGNISVSGMMDINTNKIYAIGCASNALCAWLNYGDVTTNLTNPRSTYIGAVDFDGTVADSDIIAGTGINYGTFNAARLSGKGSTSQWYVDLSGRKGVIPSAKWNYSTDPTANNIQPWCVDDELFDVQKSLERTGYEGSTDAYVFNYEEMIKPTFGFIFNNPLALKYKTASMKDEYNGENILDYTETSDLRGQTLAFLSEKYPEMAGAFCLNSSSLKENETAGYLDIDIEDCANIADFEHFTVNSRWGEKTVNELFASDLNQRDVGTTAKLHHDITIESVEKQQTKAGSMATLKNKTSLVPFQAPVGGSLNTFITIADLYMVTNEFSAVEGQNIDFKLSTLNGSKNIHFRYFTEPVIYDNESDMVAKIRQQFRDVNYTGLDIDYRDDEDACVTLPVPMAGQSTLALVGLAVSENGKKTNALVLRINSAGSKPSGWLTKFSYPTGVNAAETALVNTDMLTDTETNYTESNIYEDTDKYTVSTGTQVTESYGEITYPIYTMATDMWHTTDGAMENNYGIYTNAITNSGSLYTKFAVKNTDNFIVYVNDGSETTWFSKGTMPTTNSMSSDNGVETIKYMNSDSVSNYAIDSRVYGTMYSFSKLRTNTIDTSAGTGMSNQIDSLNIDNNPFGKAGEKTITVGTKSASGEFVTLFKVVLNKAVSGENYLKDKQMNRYDNLTKDKEAVFNETKTTIEPSIFSTKYFDTYSQTVSTLATASKASANVYGDFVEENGTYYPTTISNMIDVTAEDGTVHSYTHTYTLPTVTEMPIWRVTDTSNRTLSVNTNEPCVIYGDEIAGPQFRVYYSGRITDAALERAEIYVDGVLSQVVYRNNNYWEAGNLHFSWGSSSCIEISEHVGFTMETLPDGIITVKPIIRINTSGNTDNNQEVFTVALRPFSFTKTLQRDHRAIRATWDQTIVTSAISTLENKLSEDVDIYGDGTIDYTLTPDTTNRFYIMNSVNPDCTSNTISIALPSYAKLQEYNGTEWTTVFTARFNNVYSKTFTYSYSDLQAGCHYNFRIVAQAYDESNEETKELVSYYYTTITAATRNKNITIEFDNGNETMDLYREIINAKGSTAIQIKNMNGEKAVLQQTKLYKGTSADAMESTYYRLAQGDYAVDVQIPKGYKASVKIVADSQDGSSEGYLVDSTVVKGKRFRLPYANEQNIHLVVYLERDEAQSTWGVSYEKSLYQSNRQNNI